MRVGIIGSRNLKITDFSGYLPQEATEIISGGARGIDSCAREYAKLAGIPIKEFLPDYETYGKRAPLVRNDEIVKNSDLVLAFWDGESRGTAYVVRRCGELGVPLRIYKC